MLGLSITGLRDMQNQNIFKFKFKLKSWKCWTSFFLIFKKCKPYCDSARMYFKIKLELNQTLNNPWFNFHSVRIDHNWVTLISKRRQNYCMSLGNFWFCRLKVNNWSINNFSTTCQLINWPCGLCDFLAILVSLKTLLSDFALYKKN